MNHTHEQKTGDTSGKAAAHRQAKRMDQDTSVEDGISHEFAEMANNSAQATQLKTIQTAANRYTQSQSMPIPTQAQPVGENRTGLPDGLKAGIEHLSGFSMSDVKVHYNSSKPATLQAHAYAQGTQIHLAPGQERHLPHEAWHVVQQKQGRVRPTLQMKGVDINDDKGLEGEADRMGALALRSSPALPFTPPTPTGNGSGNVQRRVVQRFGEELGLYEAGMALAALVSVETLRRLYQWTPQGRTKTDMLRIARAIGVFRLNLVGDVVALAGMPWTMPNVLQLATEIGTNANGLAVNEWVNIATALAVQNPNDVALLARLQGWASADIVTLTQNYVAGNAGGHTVANWVAIATQVPANDHTGATALARLPGWNFVSINTVVLNRAAGAGNPNAFSATQWAGIAAHVPANDHAGATALARIAGWNFVSVNALATAGAQSNFNGHTPAQWATIAGRLAPNAHADAAALADIPNWQAGNIAALANRYSNNNPHNRPLNTWITVAGLTRLRNQADHVSEFMNLPAGWNDVNTIGLARVYSNENGGRTATTWCNIAAAHANLYGHRTDVEAFVNLPVNWQNARVVTLAGHFGAGNNGLSATQWANIAQASAAMRNEPDRVNDFAGMANWNYQGMLQLATEFNNNPRNYSSAQWVTIANTHAGLYNQAANVAEFARMAGWAANHAAGLAGRFAGNNTRNFTAAQWAQIAVADAVVRDQPARVETFANMANWQHANITGLVQAFATNPRNFTAAQWVAIANAGARLHDQEADVGHFAGMANWTHAHILGLAQLYDVNNNNRSAQHWTSIANAHANLYNQEADVNSLAQLPHAITTANLITVAVRLMGTLTANQTVALINRLHANNGLTGAHMATLVPTVTVARLNAVSQGLAPNGDSFGIVGEQLMAGAWTGAHLAAAVNDSATPGNAPTANAFCGLLALCQQHNLSSARLVRVLQTVNPPNANDWVTVPVEFNRFQGVHAQPPGFAGMGGARVGLSYTYNNPGAPAILVEVEYLAQRLQHFREGHTYEAFHFHPNNVFRAGSPYSFWAIGTNVQNTATAALAGGIPPGAADAIRNNAFRSGFRASFASGFDPPAGLPALVAGNTYIASMTMLYPRGAAVASSINSEVLDAIGKLFNHY